MEINIHKVLFYFKEGTVTWEPETRIALNNHGDQYKWLVSVGMRKFINTSVNPNMTQAKRLLRKHYKK